MGLVTLASHITLQRRLSRFWSEVLSMKLGGGNEIVQFLHDGGETVAAKQGFGAGASTLERERWTCKNAGVECNVFRFGHSGGNHIAQQAQEPRLIGIDAAGILGHPDIEGALNAFLARRQLIQAK